MLRSLGEFDGYKVQASDDEVGSVCDFYFDDEHWTIRYLIVDTGVFFSGRRVLVSPVAFRRADSATRRFHLGLTRAKVKDSPGLDLAKPISRQDEAVHSAYYGWPYYWNFGGSGIWGGATHPAELADRPWSGPERPEGDGTNPHLRSVREVVGYRVQGTDGDIGHVQDVIVDDETWAIRYLVIDTSNWWGGRKVLVAPRWAERISWAENNVYVDLPRQRIKDGPEWDPDAPVNREYEGRLHDHYGRPVYWNDGDKR